MKVLQANNLHPRDHVFCVIEILLSVSLSLGTVGMAQTSPYAQLVYSGKGILSANSMKCDGETDDTAAFDALVASAVSANGPPAAPVELSTIQLPSGKCRFASAPQAIAAGIKIVGALNQNGTWLIADYNEPNPQNGFLTWNSSYRAAGSGIGGGLEHLHISKGSNKIGGSAIKLMGSDDLHRAGFMLFDDLYINSAFGSPGYWHHHVILDGICCNTKGSNGIRDVTLSNFYFGQSEPPSEGESIVILNGVHIYLSNGLIFASKGGGIRISGLDNAENHMSHDVLITNVNILGSLYIQNAEGIIYNGWLAGKLVTAKSTKNCFVAGIISNTIVNEGNCAIFTNDKLSISGPIGTRDSDSAGILTLHNGKSAYRFHHTFSVPPICTATDTESLSPVRVKSGVNFVTIFGEGSHQVSYICISRD